MKYRSATLFLAFFFFLATSVRGKLIREPDETTKCYPPPEKNRMCSIFPFSTSLSPFNETKGINYMDTWMSSFECPSLKKEKHEREGRAFLCYLALGVCQQSKWGIPSSERAQEFLEMLNSETFQDVSNGDSKKKALCKQTCVSIIELIYNCDTFFKNGLRRGTEICSMLPEKNCIDGSELSDKPKNGATSNNALLLISLLGLFVSTLPLILMP